MKLKFSILAVAGAMAMMGSAQAVTTINFWHSMDGALGEEVARIVNDFNRSQSDYKVIATYKGGYQESMNAGIAAYRAGQAPNIIQVFEVGTATMMYSKGAIEPVGELSQRVGNPINSDDFVPGIAAYYSDAKGHLVSMPFNSSSPVFYYNKDLFAKAGLDPNKPPKTYAELHEYGKKLKAAGVECAYSTSWPAWVLIENYAAIHNAQYATQSNGFDGLNARLTFNTEPFKKQFNYLLNMAKEGTFTYAGRADKGNGLFSAGKCAMFTGSSGSRKTFLKANINFGTSFLPYYADVAGAPHNSIIGGASLWVFSKKTLPEYKATIAFLKYLATPEVAAAWHQNTGYVPVVKAAYDLTKAQGYYDKNPGTDIAVRQLNRPTVANSRGIRLGFLPAIRDVEERNLEELFSNKVNVNHALKSIERESNKLLERFQKQSSR